jgi:hypothetical protein
VIKSGVWKPSVEKADFVPLSDVINPAGPIGFFGNYAVFYLKNGAVAELNEALTYYRLQYAEPSELFIAAADGNSGSAQVKGEITRPLVITYHPYDLTFQEKDGTLKYTLSLLADPLSPKVVSEDNYRNSELKIDLTEDYGFTLDVTGVPQNGDAFTIIATHPRLCDPELKVLRERYPVIDDEDYRRGLFDDELIAEMLELMPGLRQKLIALRTSTDDGDEEAPPFTWNDLEDKQRDYLISVYHEFRLRREHTRRFVVDTNSLILNLYSGSGSTLEPFKRAHRFLDVVKAATEVERRKALLAHEQYGDPDIERVVLVSDKAGLSGLVAGVESKEEEPATAEPGRPDNK